MLAIRPAVAHAKDYTAERFDSRIEVMKGGSLRVTETIVIRFETGTFSFFYRTMPTSLTDGMDFVSATMDGRAFPVGEDPGQVEVGERTVCAWSGTSRTPRRPHTPLKSPTSPRGRTRDQRAGPIAWRALPSEHDYRIESAASRSSSRRPRQNPPRSRCVG